MNLAWFEPLEWKYFSDYFSHLDDPAALPAKPDAAWEPKKLSTLRQRKGAAEREMLVEALEMFHGNKTAVARELGISRTILYQKLHKYDLI